MKRHNSPPRKVIIGSCIQSYNNCPAGLDARIDLANSCINRIIKATEEKYPGRPCDLVCLPECALTNGGKNLTLAERAVELEGRVLDTFSAKAREGNFNLVLPLTRATDRKGGIFHNSAAVINRKGELVGVYNKLHPVVQVDCTVPESGMTPGETDVPVFDLDFGRIGVQICFDMLYADGWSQLADKGAEIVVWPSASPATIQARCRAERFGYYLVATPFRDNTTIYEPNGMIAATALPPCDTLVQEVDLSWMVLHWSPRLNQGQIFTERYGDDVGYHYEYVEDIGLFWSNKKDITIGQMAEELGLEERTAWLERNTQIVNAARDKAK